MRTLLKTVIGIFIIHSIFDLVTLCHNFHLPQIHEVFMDFLIVWLAAELLPRYKGVIIWWNKKCPNCNGVGHFTKTLSDDSPRIIAKEKCSYCEGSGKVPKKKKGVMDVITKGIV